MQKNDGIPYHQVCAILPYDYILVKTYGYVVKPLLAPQSLLKGLAFEEKFEAEASACWVLDFFIRGPPPIAIEYLTKQAKGKIYEKLVKLEDVRRSMDCRAVIITNFTPKPDAAKLCSASGISLVLETDIEGLTLALGGALPEEVNQRIFLHFLKSRDRQHVRKCREDLRAALDEECLTLKEVVSRLKWTYSEKDIAGQVRRLLRSGEITILARNRRGEGIYGAPDRSYRFRADLSGRCRKEAVRSAALALVSKSHNGVESGEIATALNITLDAARICLRDLAKQSKILKKGNAWHTKK